MKITSERKIIVNIEISPSEGQQILTAKSILLGILGEMEEIPDAEITIGTEIFTEEQIETAYNLLDTLFLMPRDTLVTIE